MSPKTGNTGTSIYIHCIHVCKNLRTRNTGIGTYVRVHEPVIKVLCKRQKEPVLQVYISECVRDKRTSNTGIYLYV